MKKILLGIVLLALGVGGYFYLRYATYTNVHVVKKYEVGGSDNANYMECMGGVLRYSKDGVVLLAEGGEEKWNQACQMNNPVVATCENTVALGDKGGTAIYVFQEKGLKGEIQTARPIEKISVSKQGIVATILKDEESPLVICYDAEGNLLVKHTTSLASTGYPIDVAISEDGKVMAVSYMMLEGNVITGRIAYYNFGAAGENKKEHLVFEKKYEDTLIPTVDFLDEERSILVSDKSIFLCEGLDKPAETSKIDLQGNILSVAYDEKLIAVVLKDDQTSELKLYIYDQTGKELSAVGLEREYANMKVSGRQVLLYEENRCCIVSKIGIKKFEGELEVDIIEMYPLSGLKKYMVISASGFQVIQLAK